MKIRRRLLRNFSPIKLSIWPTLVLLSGQTIAMPKYNAHGAEVNALQAFAVSQDPVLKGTLIMADDKSPVLYVSPSSKKVQTGIFQQLAFPACHILERHYNLTYLMPNVPVEQYAAFAKAGPYSPFFDFKFGNYARQSTLLSQINTKVAQIQQIKEKHRDVIAAYEKDKGRFEDAQNAYNKAEAAYAELDNNVAKFSLLWLNATTSEAREMMKIELDKAKQIRTEENSERKETLRVAMHTVFSQQLAYREAKERYDRTIPNHDEMKQDLASLMEFF